jgi:hypothetical protein
MSENTDAQKLLSDQVAAAVRNIPKDQLHDALAWTEEYLRQLNNRVTDLHYETR